MKNTELEHPYAQPDEDQFARENPLDSEDEPAVFGCTLDNDIRELMQLDWITREDN